MQSHKLPDNPFEDPFASGGEVEQLPADSRLVGASAISGLFAILASILLVGLILTAPARATPVVDPTPRPIILAVCAPPSCIVSTVEQTPTPTSTPTPEPTETLAVATVRPKPEWLSYGCLMTMQKIMQYELNGSTDNEAYRFLATQLIWRANSNKACDFDGQWTGYTNSADIQPITGAALNSVLTDYPTMNWPYCQFVGSFGDVRTWLLKKMVDRSKPIIGFYADPYGNIFGVNCTPG
jgi:hypothetical protein